MWCLISDQTPHYKNKKMKKLIPLILTLLICACNNSTKTIQSNNDCSEELPIYQAMENKIQELGDYIEWIKIIPLETNSNSIVSYIINLEFSDQFIYIVDMYHNISIFDKNGLFIQKLKRGNGPGELSQPRDIHVDDNDSCLYINDFLKLIKYSFNGRYIATYYYDPENEFEKFVIDNGNIVGTKIKTMSDSMFVIHTDTTFQKTVKTYIGKANFRDSYISTLQKTENGILISKPMNKNIYCFNNGVTYQKYTLNNGLPEPEHHENKGPKTKEQLIEESKIEQDNVFLGYFHISKKYQIFHYTTMDGHVLQVYHNKETGKFASVSGECLFANEVYDYNENVFASRIPADYALEIANSLNNLISPEDMEKLKSVKEDDNPIIVLFKLKDDI